MLTMSFLQAQVNDWEENIITPPGGGLTNDSGFGDFDNDGDEDIVTINNDGIFISLNEGIDTVFSQIKISEIGGKRLIVHDTDSDGDLDLIAHNSLLINNGTGVFTEMLNILADDSERYTYELADINGDGIKDVLTAAQFDDRREGDIYVIYANGDNTFGMPTVLLSDFGGKHTIAVADTDADGDDDIVLGRTGSPFDLGIYFFENIEGVLESNYIYSTPFDVTHYMALIQHDDDEYYDIFYAQENVSLTIFKLADIGANAWEEEVEPIYSNIIQVASLNNRIIFGDFNGSYEQFAFGQVNAIDLNSDGNTDLLSRGSTAYINDGDGTNVLINRIAIVDLFRDRGIISSADIDNDGLLDMVHDNHYYRNTGEGGFENIRRRFAEGRPRTDKIILEDFDGDGDVDYLNLSNNGKQLILFRNDGTGWFPPSDGQVIINTSQSISSADAGDFDNDGDIDFVAATDVWAAPGVERIWWLENDGTGNFEVHNFDTDVNIVVNLRAGDIDNDGDTDFVSRGGSGNSQIQVYENIGDMTFADYTIVYDGAIEDVIDCYLEDLDGDGDLDMLVSNDPSPGYIHRSEWYRNDGATWSLGQTVSNYNVPGTFGEVYTYPVDMDSDGDIDILESSSIRHRLKWLENDGQGIFTPADTIHTDFCGELRDVYIMDVNGDNNPDPVLLYIGNTADETCNLESGEVRNISWFANPYEFTPSYTTNVEEIFCMNNETPTDGTDDYLQLQLTIDALDISGNYQIEISGAAISPTTGTYGESILFTLDEGSSNNGDILVTIIDGSNPEYGTSFTISNPGNCTFTSTGIQQVECQDNETIGDDTDDYISFMLDIANSFSSDTYEISAEGLDISPNIGNYAVPVSFSLSQGSAQSGDITIAITDSNNPEYQLDLLVINPGVCSVSSIEENSSLNYVVALPNPFQESFTVRIGEDQGQSKRMIRVVDGRGLLVSLIELGTSETSINGRDWETGIYFWQIEDKETRKIEAVGKIMKNK